MSHEVRDRLRLLHQPLLVCIEYLVQDRNVCCTLVNVCEEVHQICHGSHVLDVTLF